MLTSLIWLSPLLRFHHQSIREISYDHEKSVQWRLLPVYVNHAKEPDLIPIIERAKINSPGEILPL